MKKFVLKGQAIFSAEDIVDAFRRLGQYYASLANCCEEEECVFDIDFEPGTDLQVEPYGVMQ